MMKQFSRLHILAGMALSVMLFGSLSCSRRVESNPDTIDLVNTLLADSLPQLEEMAARCGQNSGTIAIIGEPSACAETANAFLTCDDFDNIDAKQVSDGLPDFAGERIFALLDSASSPYSSLLAKEDGIIALREAVVKDVLMVMDSSVRCKAIILCSPLMAEYGAGDVTDLLEEIGSDVPVIFSADTAFSYTRECFSLMRDRNMFTHDIAYPSLETFMTAASSDRKSLNVISFAFPADTTNVQDSLPVRDSLYAERQTEE